MLYYRPFSVCYYCSRYFVSLLGWWSCHSQTGERVPRWDRLVWSRWKNSSRIRWSIEGPARPLTIEVSLACLTYVVIGRITPQPERRSRWDPIVWSRESRIIWFKDHVERSYGTFLEECCHSRGQDNRIFSCSLFTLLSLYIVIFVSVQYSIFLWTTVVFCIYHR